jgi:Uma2 family endonuclease
MMTTQKPSGETTTDERVTFEEYLKLGYEGRVEWVDGKVEQHMPVSLIHVEIFGFLYLLLRFFLNRTKLGVVKPGGYPIRLSELSRAREPDLMIILSANLDRMKPTYFDGAPDVCIEIVSPESVGRDYEAKFSEYEAAGVPEYWLFDPERRAADIYALNEDGKYASLPLDQRGRLVSRVLPGFTLEPALLWQPELPNEDAILDLVAEMVKAAEG